MEEDFLDLGFVDQSILADIEEIKEEPAKENKQVEGNQEPEIKENPGENIETNNNKPKGKEEVVENPATTENLGSPNLSSSIAEALVDDGVLQTLSKERLAEIKDAESLVAAYREDMDNQVESRLDDITKRVHHALTYGVEPTKIQQYEQWIETLDSVTDEIIEGEEEQNENYRKNLIFQNYKSKGFDDDEAKEMVNRSVESGKDIDDAKKALESLKKFYKKSYDDEVADAKKQYEAHVEKQKKQLKDLKDSIIEDKENFYDQFEVSKTIRQKIFDTVAKPSIVDGETKITPLQKFIKDDPNKANKIIGTLYVITDGFTNFSGIMKGTVKKEVRKSVENLQRVIAQTKPQDGSMSFKSGIGQDNSNLKILDFDFED